MPATIAQAESSNFDRTSVGMIPVISSPSVVKSPTPSISLFFGRIRSPVISPAPSFAQSRVSSNAPSIGPAAHAGRACEDVEDESRLNKDMTQEMNIRLMGLEKCIEQRDAELKIKEDANTENESKLLQLKAQCNLLRQELDLSHTHMEKLQDGCEHTEDLRNLKTRYETQIARLQSCISEMRFENAEMSNSSLLDSQKIETMTDEIAELKESHRLEVDDLEQELAREQIDCQIKYSELKQQEQDLQELIAKAKQDDEIASNHYSDELLLEKLAFAEGEVDALKSDIEKLKEANDFLQRQHLATLQAEREQIDKLQNDLDSLKKACHVHQAELVFQEREAENLRFDERRRTEDAVAELDNTRHELGTKLRKKDAEISKVKTELAAKKDFILKLLKENANLKDDNKKISGTLWDLKEYAEMMVAAEEKREKDPMASRISTPCSPLSPAISPKVSKPKNKGTTHIKTENKQLKGKVNQLTTADKENKAKIASLEAELESLKVQLAPARSVRDMAIPTNHQTCENVSIRSRGFDNPFANTLEILA